MCSLSIRISHQDEVFDLLNELQVKEQEILNLRKPLSTEKSRVIKSADIKPTKYSGSADLEDFLAQFNSIAKFNS